MTNESFRRKIKKNIFKLKKQMQGKVFKCLKRLMNFFDILNEM